jgi:hypothetical protein
LYANENFPLPAVRELRRLGHDVLTTTEAGQAGQAAPDEAVLALAHREGRAVVTFNRRHFIRLHEAGGGRHSGIIVCTADFDFAALAGRIHAAMVAGGPLAGRLVRVTRV